LSAPEKAAQKKLLHIDFLRQKAQRRKNCFTIFSPVRRRRCAALFGASEAGDKAMHKVYVLKSQRSGKRYVGVTSQDLTLKLEEHNAGTTTWTRSHKPFELIYSQEFQEKTKAIKREKFLKTGDGRRFLDSRLG